MLLLVFLESAKQHVCPSPGYQHQGGAPSHMPSWLPPTLHSLHRNGPMWFQSSVDPRFFSPILKTGHPTLHTLSPPSPSGAGHRAGPNEQDACERADYQIPGHSRGKWVCSARDRGEARPSTKATGSTGYYESEQRAPTPRSATGFTRTARTSQRSPATRTPSTGTSSRRTARRGHRQC